ncbi:MAG TPA: outer membrane lipoprotein chaperone LolA [Bacteroidota bacterium]|nr:outer membrane lipoprotein chaperone LolA [Bacteroidota bacterium]
MMREVTLSLLLFVLGSTAVAQEKELTVKFITDQIQHRYEMIDDAVAQFQQQVKFGYSTIEQSFSGTLYMKKPNRYRIESEHQTIVTDGISVWAYSPANNQVIIDHYKENQNSLTPDKFMLNLPSNYYATFLGTEKEKSGEQALLKLVPKDDRSFIKSVKIWVEENNWMVKKILILDVNETTTTYTINDIKLNVNLKERTFSFTPPAGAETVDLR